MIPSPDDINVALARLRAEADRWTRAADELRSAAALRGIRCNPSLTHALAYQK